MFAIISTSGDRDVKDISKKVSITGYVKDNQGNYVSGALVVLTQGEVQPDASNVVKSTTTDSTGTFQFYNLLPGNYGLAVWLNSTTVRIIKKKFPYIETQVIFAGLDPENSISAADINPSIVGGLVTGIVINNPGSGYSSVIPPIITFDGGYVGECTVDNPTGAITGVRTIKQGSAATLTNTSTPSILTNITEKIENETEYPSTAGTSGATNNTFFDEWNNIEDLFSLQARWTNSPAPGSGLWSYGQILGLDGGTWDITTTAGTELPAPEISWGSSYYSAAWDIYSNQVPVTYWQMTGGICAYKVGEILVHPDSPETLKSILGVSGYYTGNSSYANNGYITINLVEWMIVDWSGIYMINENGNYSLPIPENMSYYDWATTVGSVIKYPAQKLFGSRQEALQAIDASKQAIKNATSNYDPINSYQTDDDSTLSQQILDFFSGKAEIVKNSINSLFDPNDRYEVAEIYWAVKSKGLELYRQGLISEQELQIAKGFLGRDLIVAPVLANWLGYTGSAPDNILLRTIATIPSSLLVIGYQIADAATTEETWYEALFDGVTQNYGVLTVTPPAWVTNRTFNVGGINKQYINGSWVNI